MKKTIDSIYVNEKMGYLKLWETDKKLEFGFENRPELVTSEDNLTEGYMNLWKGLTKRKVIIACWGILKNFYKKIKEENRND